MISSSQPLAKQEEALRIEKDLQDIIKLLEEDGPKKPHEIRMILGLSKTQWALRLGRLRGLGLIEVEVRETLIKTPTGRYRCVTKTP